MMSSLPHDLNAPPDGYVENSMVLDASRDRVDIGWLFLTVKREQGQKVSGDRPGTR